MPHPASRARQTPRYVQIATELRDRIVDLAPHTLLPSERELSEQHGVSRMTARQAVTVLESEGVVYRRPPRGTFVAEPRVRLRIGSFSDEVTRRGRRPDARLLWSETQPATPATASALALAPGDPVNVFHRLRLVDDVPLALETTCFPAALTPGLLDSPVEGSLWAAVSSRFGLTLSRSDAVLESIVLDDASATRLNVRPASAGVLLTRRTYDTTGRCVEYARDLYRADRVAFEVSETITDGSAS